MFKNKRTYLILGSVGLVFIVFLVLSNNNLLVNKEEQQQSGVFADNNLATNTDKAAIDLSKVLSGGPGKDGIPAINSPSFVNADNTSSNLRGDSRGILFENDGVSKFYPYNILVWHEIVNDQVGGKPVSITFCPLCGSAIVYDRVVDGEVLTFGVSGLLYESNLLMYDQQTESLWSQIEGEVVVGDKLGQKLKILSSQLLTFTEAQNAASNDLQVLSENTGFNRDYGRFPYGSYNESEELLFPVTYKDQRLPAKEIMYASTYQGTPVAFAFDTLKEKGEAQVKLPNGDVINATYTDPEVHLTGPQDENLPGYFTQWFSWANHNLPDGVNPDANGVVWGIPE